MGRRERPAPARGERPAPVSVGRPRSGGPRRVALLCRALRAEGVNCSLPESVTALRALPWLEARDVEDVRLGLRAVFCSSPRDFGAFERCFWSWWEERRDPVSSARTHTAAAPAASQSRVLPAAPAVRGGRADQARPGETTEREDGSLGMAYSPLESLARRGFASVTEDELRALDAWIDRLLLRLATRRSRRLEPGGRRGAVDVRRTLRRAARHEGELIRLARRRRRRDPPRLVALCDVSGSMERYSRFLLQFLLGCARARDIQTFAFSTRLTHLTPWLARTRIDHALTEMRSRGWSSGTRIGACLEEFVEGYGARLLGRRTIVIILSDGLDQGEVAPLERAMRGLKRRARRVIWLNPLLESSRYAPEARGMQAALPFVDHFAAGHSLEALRRLPHLLRL